jgi:hypothetical protein
VVEPVVVAIVLLWIVVIVQGLLLLGTLRQLGRLMTRLGGELPLDRATSLRVGDILPIALQSPSSPARRVTLFVSPTCSVCDQVLAGLSRVVPDPRQLTLVTQASQTAAKDYLDSYGLGRYPRITDPDGTLTEASGVSEVPFAIPVCQAEVRHG